MQTKMFHLTESQNLPKTFKIDRDYGTLNMSYNLRSQQKTENMRPGNKSEPKRPSSSGTLPSPKLSSDNYRLIIFFFVY